jgi:hypothetical protein
MNAAIANDRNTDHVDLLMNKVESSADATARALVNTVLSPRFYTTRFEDFDRLNVESVRAEWDAMMAEYEGDNSVTRSLPKRSSSSCRSSALNCARSSLTS